MISSTRGASDRTYEAENMRWTGRRSAVCSGASAWTNHSRRNSVSSRYSARAASVM
ncbi:hypothetical protein O1L60_29375 [Streptomyces diastatochromogenes]|nr:hypothetical protein [Streptomyces diastatochromogenes]